MDINTVLELQVYLSQVLFEIHIGLRLIAKLMIKLNSKEIGGVPVIGTPVGSRTEILVCISPAVGVLSQKSSHFQR